MTYAAGASAPERVRLLMKLESIAEIGADERQALLDLPLRLAKLPADRDIVREGDRPEECCLLLTGFACRYKIISEGRRQIISFHTPGDIPDLQSLFIKVMDHNLGTLLQSRVAFLSHRHILDLLGRFPHLAKVFWRDTLIDAAIFREWMVGLGRRTAYQRIAHLVCEMHMRMKAVGLAKENEYGFPITQAELADAAGLSAVHVNRTLMDLKRDGRMTFHGAVVHVPDWDALRSVADFDPTYLQQRKSYSLSDAAA